VPSLLARAEFAVSRMIFRLPTGIKIRLSGRPPVRIDGRTLNPEIQLLLTARRLRNGGSDSIKGSSPEHSRVRFREETMRYSTGAPALSAVHERSLPGPEGSLRARHYEPKTNGSKPPLLVYYHGGGFVIGDLDTHDDPCRLIAHHAGVRVLSIEYRLAPEHPFPAAVDDAAAALEWAQEHAAELGVNRDRIGVGGDSAGANLAAVVAQRARDAGRPAGFQLLIYPVTDAVETRPSRRLFGDGFVLTGADIAWCNEQYFAASPEVAKDPRLSPLRASDLSRLCPAVVVTAGFDPLRDEGDAYAEALRAAGNRVVHVELEGFVHGFIHMIGVSGGARGALVRAAETLRDVANG
jgi:acetyl esterase